MLNRIGSGSGNVVFVKEKPVQIGKAYQAKPFEMCEDHNWVQDVAFGVKTFQFGDFIVDLLWAAVIFSSFIVLVVKS